MVKAWNHSGFSWALMEENFTANEVFNGNPSLQDQESCYKVMKVFCCKKCTSTEFWESRKGYQSSMGASPPVGRELWRWQQPIKNLCGYRGRQGCIWVRRTCNEKYNPAVRCERQLTVLRFLFLMTNQGARKRAKWKLQLVELHPRFGRS